MIQVFINLHLNSYRAGWIAFFHDTIMLSLMIQCLFKGFVESMWQ
jgi:hypothetical protein